MPVPWDESHVFYVWFDALLNYYTALSFARAGEDLTERFWPATYHLIGKDILKFHCVFWPAMLMAAGLPVPEHVFVHGFLLMDGEKMSKSLGNVLDPFEVIDSFGSDALRFYLLRDVRLRRRRRRSRRRTSSAATRASWPTTSATSPAAPSRCCCATATAPCRRLALELAEDFEGLAEQVAEKIDGADLTGALELIWERVRRLNRFVEERKPWVLAKDDAQAPELDAVLATLAEGLRTVTVLLHPYLPEATETLLDALGAPDVSYATAGFASGRTHPRVGHRPAVSQAGAAGMIDSHTHLGSCKQPAGELVAEARTSGITRILTVGTDEESGRAELRAAEEFAEVFAAIGRHPNNAAGVTEAELEAIHALSHHPACRAIGETGLDYFRDYAPRADQERAFHAQIEMARDTGKPLVIHTRAADDDTISTLRERAHGLQVIMHCFSMADRLTECVEQGWHISFAGNVTYPNARELAMAAERVPDELLLVETDAPYLTPQPVRKERNRPAFVVHTAEFVAERRGQTYAELEAVVEANAARLFGW